MKQEYFLSQRLGFTNKQADKIREMGYLTTFGFVNVNENSRYYCKISFTEERREGKEREVTRDSNGHKSHENYLNGESSISRFFVVFNCQFLIPWKMHSIPMHVSQVVQGN